MPLSGSDYGTDAYASADDRRRTLAAGFDAHAAKPITPDALISIVAEAVKRPRWDER